MTSDAHDFHTGMIVWIPDNDHLFVKAKILSMDNASSKVTVTILSANTESILPINELQPTNPSPTFDKVDNMSMLTHLNEPSVLYNLQNRYQDDIIYTYSGLFLVALNPYTNLNLYSNDYINNYHGSLKDENPPHIFAIAEFAYQNLLQTQINQSILVTGESGAGKTENTKIILNYLSNITSINHMITSTPSTSFIENDDMTSTTIEEDLDSRSFEKKILKSNPILESFGNAQTLRNNNSSRFGKFIKIKFNLGSGKITGINIDWYLLEKSRIILQSQKERNYHIFYQLLSELSTNTKLKESLNLTSSSPLDYNILKNSNLKIPGVDDLKNFNELKNSLLIIGFSSEIILEIFKIISIILLIGNIEFKPNRNSTSTANNAQAVITSDLKPLLDLLGIENEMDFKDSILRPKSKAGKEWVHQSKNSTQSKFILNALSRSLYEHLFAFIVEQINNNLNSSDSNPNSNDFASEDDEHFIGLLDIAGFEIFDLNSFEQLCINYTNENLQQFFNNHMFILEQNEYLKENINWNYIDFGKDSIETINLIENTKDKSIPTGILPLLDEVSILPNSNNNSFYDKLIDSWDKKSKKFKRSKKLNSFIINHYAGDVEYNTEEWLSKNKDPLNEHLLSVLSNSNNPLIQSFFNTQTSSSNSLMKKKKYKTTASRHTDQLHSLLKQLNDTNPHFVRCIIPNNKKIAKSFDRKLILNQLRCNGVLEGIKIARKGYPNRIFFKEFFQRYNILSKTDNTDSIDNNTMTSSRQNCEILLKSLQLSDELYKIGNTKLFFKNGVLAKLELEKEKQLNQILTNLNAHIRSKLIRQPMENNLNKLKYSKIIGATFTNYNNLMSSDDWYNLYIKLKPLLNSTKEINKSKKFSEKIKSLELQIKDLNEKLIKSETTDKENVLKLNQSMDEINSLKNHILEKNDELDKIKLESDATLKKWESLNETNNTLTKDLKSMTDKMETREKEIETLKNDTTKIDEINTQLKEAKEKILQKDKEIITLKNDTSAADKLESQLKDLQANLISKDKKSKDDKSLIDSLNTKITKLEESLTKRDKEIITLKTNTKTNDDLTNKLKKLETELSTKEKSYKLLFDSNKSLETEIHSIKKVVASKDSQIKNLNDTLSKKENNLDGKLSLLEKECHSALTKMKTLLLDNSKLKNQIEQLTESNNSLEKKLSKKDDELENLKGISKIHSDELTTITNERDSFIEENEKLITELKSSRASYSELNKNFNKLSEKMKKLQSASSDDESLSNEELHVKIKSLEKNLANEVSLNKYLNEKLFEKIEESKRHNSFSSSRFIKSEKSMQDLLKINEDSELIVEEYKKKLHELQEDKKDLMSRLTFTETRLASSSFELQTKSSQLNTLKTIVSGLNLPHDTMMTIDRELKESKPSDINVEKILLEIEHLKRQLEIETKAKIDAENSVAALHDKFKRIQRSDSSSEIYKLKYEASAEKIRTLESKLSREPLKPLSNVSSNDLFNKRESISKYDEDLRAYRLEILNLKEIMKNSDKGVATLQKRLEEKSLNENLLLDRIKILEKDLDTTEHQNELLSKTLTSQKQQIENNLNEIHQYELQLKDYAYALKQSDEDIQQMVSNINFLKDQIKDNEQALFDHENEKNSLIMELNDTSLELKKSQDAIKLYTSEISHLKERIVDAQDRTKEYEEIDQLRSQLKQYMKIESELNKEISVLNFKLNTLTKDSEYKIEELLKQTNHYTELVEKLGSERDMLDSTGQNLKQLYENVSTEASTLSDNMKSLINENTMLSGEVERLENLLEDKNKLLNEIKYENNDSKNSIKYLQETLELRNKQTERNEELLKSLQDQLDEFKENYNEEKQNALEFEEEYRSVDKLNHQLTLKYNTLRDRLNDTRERDQWLAKIHELETKISEETELKYEEIKKNKKLEHIIGDLQRENLMSSSIADKVEDERKNFESSASQYANHIDELESQIAKQEIEIRKLSRDNLFLQDRIPEMEKEVFYWKERYNNSIIAAEDITFEEVAA
ncbi:hypothetical protein TBLA_0A10470 [Henningerozyma blattae CBS 6284]|uniref:Myosin motor domain-containing protein n=1 Tax=Henningerozyma blattae (strain ATCC 34711 / CBS 6284 / DSM 70876 / NBRC 10599 / NRRL Y-10934 / UCD 77-7) TaxID=1071380 RepID=I2GXH3_HENB6|nr:hypothetical protein TBLA_0A10470 [Tetrapisispora blattae CBS 6284]CCH58825.1 hypothetical protein TBLA_0A10470 [Tetrapisispora blattae CBS 6284]